MENEELESAFNERKKNKITEKICLTEYDRYHAQGWEIVKEYRNGKLLVDKEKSIGDQFENEVWCIFRKMGFKIMNGTNDFAVSYSLNNHNLTKQIDVVAIDDEVCLLIECKATERISTKQWKTELESINGYYGGIVNEIKTKYPNRKMKYIFATKNYVIGQQDKDRMSEFKIVNFEYDTIRYYNELVTHLGAAAKYQLLGNLFAKTTIKGMEERVPAIQGKMGGLTYYSFSIEPERLLKIAYILHRNNANIEYMPTYQRLIKKERLKAIREFINSGGYFPNSLIISIDPEGRELTFDQSELKVENSVSKIGILHLPKKYQSAYVIDGQHRLYGYS